jgi:hypothetical protein
MRQQPEPEDSVLNSAWQCTRSLDDATESSVLNSARQCTRSLDDATESSVLKRRTHRQISIRQNKISKVGTLPSALC